MVFGIGRSGNGNETMKDLIKEDADDLYSAFDDDDGLHLICEMATVGWPVINKVRYKLSIHGVNTSDRPIPHIHLDRADDPERRRFKFEISLTDFISTGEPVLVLQKDLKRHIFRTNRTECSWDGYSRLRNGVIEYLRSGPEEHAPRGSRSNLESFIIYWNNESGPDPDRLAKYLRARNIDVLEEFRPYFPYLYPQEVGGRGKHRLNGGR